jgi:hypothetical protein
VASNVIVSLRNGETKTTIPRGEALIRSDPSERLATYIACNNSNTDLTSTKRKLSHMHRPCEPKGGPSHRKTARYA